MNEHDWLAERFEEYRAHLRAVAYRMLGSLSEADDAVQEAWLRLSRSNADSIENLGAWLTPRGVAGRTHSRSHREPRGPDRSRAGSAARRRRRARVARGARDADA